MKYYTLVRRDNEKIFAYVNDNLEVLDTDMPDIYLENYLMDLNVLGNGSLYKWVECEIIIK